jgi:exosortase H (IPTLxxWG-CTERM-specific)
MFTFLNWIPSAYVDAINRYTAGSTGLMMHLAGMAPVVKGTLISAGGFSVKIITECSAVFISILFASFVISYPAPLPCKFKGMALGIAALIVINNLRVMLVVFVGIHFPSLFSYAHVYIGQIVMIFVVFLCVIIWLRSAAGIDTQDTPAGFIVRLFAFSCLLFLLWLPLAQGFVRANLYLVKWILAPFDFTYILPESLSLYPDTFNSFQLVAYAALVLATKVANGLDKLKPLLTGLAALVMSHFLFRLTDVLFNVFHHPYAFRPFVALIILSQWGLPFLLWMTLMRKEMFSPKDIFICPICGEEKIGIIEHIHAKHKDQAYGW